MHRLLVLLVGFLFVTIPAAISQVKRVENLSDLGESLAVTWVFRAGDDRTWSQTYLDDQIGPGKPWQPLNPAQPVPDLLPQLPNRIGWLRLRIQLDSTFRRQPVLLRWRQAAATEVFANGQLVRATGIVSSDSGMVKAVHGLHDYYAAALPDSLGRLVLAVRFVVEPTGYRAQYGQLVNNLLTMTLLPNGQETTQPYYNRWQALTQTLVAGLLLMMAILHAAFYAYDTSQRANLFVALATFFLSVASLSVGVTFLLLDELGIYESWSMVSVLCYPLGYGFLLTALYRIFDRPQRLVYYACLLALVVFALLGVTDRINGAMWAETGSELVALSELIRVTVLSWRQRGANIIGFGMGGALFCFLLFFAYDRLEGAGFLKLDQTSVHLFYIIGVCCVPIAMSLYLARTFVATQRRLTGQLLEIQRLSKQSFGQEQDRQQLLMKQKDMLAQQVAERTAQLQQSLDELRTTQDQLVQKEKMASLGELTAGIAHEIQNPLNFVNNFSEVSTELVKELEEEREKGADRDTELEAELLADLNLNLSKISHHGQRASAIVRSMLQHSRTSTGQREPTDINELADEYLRLSYHGLRAKEKSFNATMDTDFAADLPSVSVVGQDIGRVLLNLFNNAFYAVQQKYLSGAGGAGYQPSVRVQTRAVPGGVEVRVSDNGVGMNEEVAQKLFQPFFTTKPAGSGTGLGLSLSYDIITKGHGGSLRAESTEGEGATFIVMIPNAR
ncbi:sensor histidine kinase [Fibrella aquatilis]|nr:ATP-binding protein [Fibrella aquatilis]